MEYRNKLQYDKNHYAWFANVNFYIPLKYIAEQLKIRLKVNFTKNALGSPTYMQ